MAKKETKDMMIDFYARYLSIAQGIINVEPAIEGADLHITAEQVNNIIHHSFTAGFAVCHIFNHTNDIAEARVIANEFLKFYTQQLMSFLPAKTTDK